MSHNSAKGICHLRGSVNVPITVFTRSAVQAKGGMTRVGFILVTTKRGRLILTVFASERLVTLTRSGTIALFDNGTVLIGVLTACASVEANLLITRCTRDFAQRTKKTVGAEAMHQGKVEIVVPIVLVFSNRFLIILETQLTLTIMFTMKIARGDFSLGVLAVRPLEVIWAFTRLVRMILAAPQTKKSIISHTHFQQQLLAHICCTYKSLRQVPPLTQKTDLWLPHGSGTGISQYFPT